MVGKINHISSLYGTINYNHEKLLASHACIISGNKMIKDVTGMPDNSMQKILLSFENHLFANKNTEKPVIHISLNPAPEDRLTDDEYANLARDYMEKMGYGNQPFVVYKHEDIGRHHIHIVSLCVDENGNKIPDNYEWNRSMKICRELEIKYNLKQIDDKRKELDSHFLHKVNYEKGDIKRQISNILKSVGSTYKYQTFGEYNALLSCFNIEAKQVRGEFRGEPYNGIVYSVTDDSGKVLSVPFKSSLFGKTYGHDALEKRMKRTADNFKKGKFAPQIKNDIMRAKLTSRNNRSLFVEMLKLRGIDTIFRENGSGRIYGITFIDHNNKAVFNGSRLGKEFSANIFNNHFNAQSASSADNTHYDTEQGLFGGFQNETYHKGSSLEETFGLLGFEQHGPDYEEEAFAKRMKKKKKRKKRPGQSL